MNENEFYSLDLGITKCYLVKCLGGFLLVDTGYRSDYEKFLKRMRKVLGYSAPVETYRICKCFHYRW